MIKAIKSLAIAILAVLGIALINNADAECICVETESGCECLDGIQSNVGLMTWDEWHADETAIALAEFDRIFAAIEFKVARNGRSMVKGINDKSFKFVKMA